MAPDSCGVITSCNDGVSIRTELGRSKTIGMADGKDEAEILVEGGRGEAEGQQ